MIRDKKRTRMFNKKTLVTTAALATGLLLSNKDDANCNINLFKIKLCGN